VKTQKKPVNIVTRKLHFVMIVFGIWLFAIYTIFAATEKTNIAPWRNGGRVTASSVYSNSNPAWKLIDGRTDTEPWMSEYDVVAPELVFSFFDNRSALIDSVILEATGNSSYWPREFEILVSEESNGENYKSAGKFIFEQKTGPQVFTFNPIKAKCLKLKILSNYGASRTLLTEVIISEAEKRGYVSILLDAFSRIVKDDKINDMTNIALWQNGGRIISVSSVNSTYNPAWKIIDNKINTDPWITDSEDKIREVIFSFFDNRSALVDGIILHPGQGDSSAWPHEFEVYASSDKLDAGFKRLGRFILQPKPEYQLVMFTPTQVKYLKLKVITNYGGWRTQLAEVKVLEAKKDGYASILSTAYSQVITAEEMKDMTDLASFSQGGRIISASSVNSTYNPAWKMIDDRIDTDPWVTNSDDKIREVVLSFYDNRSALVNGIILHPGQGDNAAWPHEFEVYASSDKVDAGFERLGRYILQPKPEYQLAMFSPAQAKYLKLKILSNYGGWRTQISEVNILEAKKEGYESIIKNVFSRPVANNDIKGRMNIALAALGGKIESFTSSYDDERRAENLIDGREKFAGATTWVSAADFTFPQEIVFSFFNGKNALIDKISFIPMPLWGDTGDAAGIRDVEIWASTTYSGEQFSKIGSFILRDDPQEQLILFEEPFYADKIKMKILSIHKQNGMPAFSEFRVWESQKEEYVSILDDFDINILERSCGGYIVRFTSQYDNEKYCASQLIDGGVDTIGWSSLTGDFPQDIVFGFGDNQKVLIKKIVVNPKTDVDPSTWVKNIQYGIALEPGTDNFDFEAMGGAYILTKDPVWQPIEFPEPIETRFLKIRINANYGGVHTSLGEVRVIEGKREGYESMLTRFRTIKPFTVRGTGDTDEEKEMGKVDEGTVLESEPNDTVENANTLTIGQRLKGWIKPAGEKDFYKIDLTDAKRDILNIELEGEPYIRTSLELTSPEYPDLKGTFDPSQALSRKETVSWRFSPMEMYLKVTEPKNSIMLIFDCSGSMEGCFQDLETAVTEYVNNVSENEELSIVRFGATIETLCDFTNDKNTLRNVIKGKFNGMGGTALYDVLNHGIKTMASRTGNRAIVIMTDGADSGFRMSYPEIWSSVRKSGIHIYTIGLGKDLQWYWPAIGCSGNQMLNNFAAATNGKFFFAPTSKELKKLYQIIAHDIRRYSVYHLRATLSGGKGALRLVDEQRLEDDREIIKGVSAAKNVEFILDASGSMRKRLGSKSKMNVAKDVMVELIQSMPENYCLGLRVYGHRKKKDYRDSELVFPCSSGNRKKLIKKIKSITKPLGQTPIAYSLEQVLKDFKGIEGDKLVVLVSDGKETCGGDPVKAAGMLRDAGIDVRVDVVGFAIADDKTRADLKAIAEIGGGQYYDAWNARELKSSLEKALEATYTIVDSKSGNEVATGTLGGPQHILAAGKYYVILDLNPIKIIKNVDVKCGEETELRLKKEGNEILVERKYGPI